MRKESWWTDLSMTFATCWAENTADGSSSMMTSSTVRHGGLLWAPSLYPSRVDWLSQFNCSFMFFQSIMRLLTPVPRRLRLAVTCEGISAVLANTTMVSNGITQCWGSSLWNHSHFSRSCLTKQYENEREYRTEGIKCSPSLLLALSFTHTHIPASLSLLPASMSSLAFMLSPDQLRGSELTDSQDQQMFNHCERLHDISTVFETEYGVGRAQMVELSNR